jgi:hypothetical protein
MLYSVGYAHARRLRTLAAGTECAAIDRLADFRGDEQDLRAAVAIYERAGDADAAAHLLVAAAARQAAEDAEPAERPLL